MTFELSPQCQEETRPGQAFLLVALKCACHQLFQKQTMSSSGWNLADKVQIIGEDVKRAHRSDIPVTVKRTKTIHIHT